MTMKVSAGFGLSGAMIAMAVLFFVGMGIVIAFGAIILLSPMTGAVFILLLFLALNYLFGGGNKTIIATIIVFVILAILFGRSIQQIFESIPIFGVIFKMVVIL